MDHFKKPGQNAEETTVKVRAAVEAMIADIRENGEEEVRFLAKKFDQWIDKPFILSDAKKAELIAKVSDQEKADIQFAHKQVYRFAKAQRDAMTDFALETEPGVMLGQKQIPVDVAGCYIPGGRYAHAASAIMSIATAKAAGVPYIVAASPPRGESINPAVAYAMDLAGADVILEMGGVHAIATMAFGLFGTKPADILVGPGNDYVAEAKRLLFGEVGIDVFAGPTESAIIADETADPMTVAVDLAGQAEHGPNSPVWLFTTDRALAEKVERIMPLIAKDMPSGETVQAAWDNYGEIIICDSREEICAISDRYACEHLQVIARDLNWWKANLRSYGSLFLGEGSTVTHGDKCSGTNHILPTKRAARYSGGLNVGKFLKTLTWQEISPEANAVFSSIGSRISRMEGMDGHARSCDWRLRKFFPEDNWDFEVADQARYS